MPDPKEIRLRIIEAVIPTSSRVGFDNPQHIINTCSELEKYVVGSGNKGEVEPDSPPARGPKRPRGKRGNPL